jgi:hypothetical protein
MRTLNLQIPETHLNQVADAIAGLGDPCPRHGDKCHKALVTLDACQLELLRLIELTGHGQITVTVTEGRPTDIHQHLNIGGTQIR